MIFTNGSIRHRQIDPDDTATHGVFEELEGILAQMQVDFVATMYGATAPKVRFKICSDSAGARELTRTDWVTLVIKADNSIPDQKIYNRATFSMLPEIKLNASQVIYIFPEWQDYVDTSGFIAYVLDWHRQLNVYEFMATPWARFKFFMRVPQ